MAKIAIYKNLGEVGRVGLLRRKPSFTKKAIKKAIKKAKVKYMKIIYLLLRWPRLPNTLYKRVLKDYEKISKILMEKRHRGARLMLRVKRERPLDYKSTSLSADSLDIKTNTEKPEIGLSRFMACLDLGKSGLKRLSYSY